MRRVLVAEPDQEIRRLLGRMVTATGCEPVPYECDGADLAVDVALVEPRLACVTELASTLTARRIPIVWLGTGAPPATLRALGVLALVKPISLQQLRDVLDAVLGRTAQMTLRDLRKRSFVELRSNVVNVFWHELRIPLAGASAGGISPETLGVGTFRRQR